jgi:hypothetical protein
MTCPRNNRSGVFKIAIAFDVIAAVLAFFLLRQDEGSGQARNQRYQKPSRST